MNSIFLKVFGCLSLIAVLASCNKSPEKKIEKVASRISSKLDLNEQQQKKLTTLKNKVIAELKAVHKTNKKEVLFEQMNTMLTKDKVSQEEILELVNRKQEGKLEFVKAILPELTDFHASLDLEQKKKIQKFSKKIYKKFSKRWKFSQ